MACESIKHIFDALSLLNAKLDGDIFMEDTTYIRHEDLMTKPLSFLDKATRFFLSLLTLVLKKQSLVFHYKKI